MPGKIITTSCLKTTINLRLRPRPDSPGEGEEVMAQYRIVKTEPRETLVRNETGHYNRTMTPQGWYILERIEDMCGIPCWRAMGSPSILYATKEDAEKSMSLL